MILRGYISKIASLLPPCGLQRFFLRLAGLKIDKDVFIAPEITLDVIVDGWTHLRKGSAVGLRVSFFNHLFEQNGRIILGYIDVGEGASIGGLSTISPGVVIGKKADIGADVKIGPGASIGNYARIGLGSVIAPLVKIGKGVVVSAGSVVLENISPYTWIQGNPAKAIPRKVNCKETEEEIDYELENLNTNLNKSPYATRNIPKVMNSES